MRNLSVAACLIAAFGISQITGVNTPGERAASTPCTPADPCDLKGSLAQEATAVSVAEPYISVPVPSASQAQASLSELPVSEKKAVAAEPRVLPEEPQAIPAALATAEPEPLIEPEGPPTVAAEPQRWVGRWRPTTIVFAYSNSHPVAPLSASVVETTGSVEPWADANDSAAMPMDAQVGSRAISRLGICSAIVSAARGNGLPIPFFANLIWQESSFHLGEISNAGALGVAQFIPETANEHGLINPFEPIHAIYTAGKFLRRLQDQYHNLGFAAAAYNAGPGRVNEWLTKHRALPAETRAYVASITGHRADQWASAFRHNPEIRLMPAKAPCAEVAAEVAATAKLVRVAKLMAELAAATKPPPAPPANPSVATVGASAAKAPQPRATTVVAKSTTPQPRGNAVAAKPATLPRANVAAAKPASSLPHAKPVVAKINERAPTASTSPKVQPKPAREATLIERIFRTGKTAAAAPARKPPVVQTTAAISKQTVAAKDTHDAKRQAVALEAYAAR